MADILDTIYNVYHRNWYFQHLHIIGRPSNFWAVFLYSIITILWKIARAIFHILPIAIYTKILPRFCAIFHWKTIDIYNRVWYNIITGLRKTQKRIGGSYHEELCWH
jgi:hypothetical protein